MIGTRELETIIQYFIAGLHVHVYHSLHISIINFILNPRRILSIKTGY